MPLSVGLACYAAISYQEKKSCCLEVACGGDENHDGQHWARVWAAEGGRKRSEHLFAGRKDREKSSLEAGERRPTLRRARRLVKPPLW